MFKIKLSLYKILAMLACFSFMLNNYLLSVDCESRFNDDEIEEYIKSSEETLKKVDVLIENQNFLPDPEKLDRICNADFYRQKDIRDFLNKVIIEIPIEIPTSIISDINNLFSLEIPQQSINENPIRINLRLCNGDLVKIPLHAMDLYADYLLKKYLKDFYVENIFKKVTGDTENFINILKELDPFAVEKRKEQNKNLHEELVLDGDLEVNLNNEIESKDKIAKDEKYYKQKEKEFLSYINKEHTLSYKNVIKDIFIKKVFLYIVFFELSLWVKDYFLGAREIRNFKQLKNRLLTSAKEFPFKIQEEHDGRQEIVFVPEISFTLYELLKIPYSSYLSSPLTTGTNYLTRLIDTFFIEQLKLYKDKDGDGNEETKKRMLFKILDSSSFELIKKFLMLAKTIKILDHSVYKKRWISHLKNNWDEFVELLNKYKEATKTLKSKENIKKIKLIEQEIKDFISKGHDVSYSFWLRHKNAAFASSEFKINLIFSIPSMCLIGNLIYEKCKHVKSTDIIDKIKDLKKEIGSMGIEEAAMWTAISLYSSIAGYFLVSSLIKLGSPNY